MRPSAVNTSSMKRHRRDESKENCGGRDEMVPNRLSKKPSFEARIGWANDFPEDFKILAKVGEGTFSTVWSARPMMGSKKHGAGGIEGLLALKRIDPTCSPTRILNEFIQMRELGGRCNVIEVTSVSRTPGGMFFFSMPFFEHDEFRHYMKGFTLGGIAAYMRSLLTALAHVHSAGVIHRDVKPGNFMYNPKSGEGRLIDFGLAEPADKWKNRAEALARYRKRRVLRRQSLARNGPGVSRVQPSDGCKSGVGGSAGAGESCLELLKKVERGGTTGFRAPEVLWRSRDQGPAVDVWAAGVILLSLLSRRYPVFPSSAEDDEMALVQIAAVVGCEEVIRAARLSGRCDITEFPPSEGGNVLEELCAPLLGEKGGGEQEGKSRAEAFDLLKGILKVNPMERLSAREALSHPFVVEA